MIATPKKRTKFLRELCHFKSLDTRFCFTLPKGVHTAKEITDFLTRKGAPQVCQVTSEDSDLDGRHMPLLDALNEILGRQIGTFLSCVPGKLAYIEDEDGRWVLERH